LFVVVVIVACSLKVQDYASEISLRSLYLREKLSSPPMLHLYNKYLVVLKRIYTTYCTRAKRGLGQSQQKLANELSIRRGSILKSKGIIFSNKSQKSKVFDHNQDTTISFDEFRMLMAESHCIDERVNVRVLKTLFMQSMQFSYSSKQTEMDVLRTTTQQSFIEFLEALARVAIAKFGDNGLSGCLENSFKRLIKEHITQLSSSELKKSRNNPEEGLGH
jgi:hypothetical protein